MKIEMRDFNGNQFGLLDLREFRLVGKKTDEHIKLQLKRPFYKGKTLKFRIGEQEVKVNL